MAEINLHLGDCLEAMKQMPDKAYDLAIVDPPYGMKELGAQTGGKGGMSHRAYHNGAIDKWDKRPTKEYFDNLRRISKEQIIWGGQYFTNVLPESRCWVCWDKVQFMPTFSKIELAWTSFKLQTELFKYRNISNDKIHPTQKPVALYKWLLHNYAKEGDKILDTHGGSMSIAIACHDMNFDLDLWELDPEYYQKGVERFNQHKAQLRMF